MSKNKFSREKKLDIPFLLGSLLAWTCFGLMVYYCVTKGGTQYIVLSVLVGIFALFITIGTVIIPLFKPSNKQAKDLGKDETATIVDYYCDNGADYSLSGEKPTFGVTLEYMDDYGKIKRFSPSESYTGKELAYLQQKNKVSIRIYKNTCVITEDLNGVEDSDITPVEPKPKQEADSVDPMDNKRIGYTFKYNLTYSIVTGLLNIAVIVILFLRMCSRIYIHFPYLIMLMYMLIMFTGMTIRYTRRTIVAKYGERTTTSKFTTHTRNYDKHSVTFTFITESGIEKSATMSINGSEYVSALKMKELPIFVYKNSAIVDLDRLYKEL